MNSSKEMRWFSTKAIQPIIRWFEEKELTFSSSSVRTDFYLPLQNKADLGIKTREGKVEIKQRMTAPVSKKLSENVEGYLEEWVKWSFKTANDDKLLKEIVEERQHDWVEVQKERMVAILTKDLNGQLILVNANCWVDYGCQIEYTRLKINGKQWFTFAFDWFGNQQIKLEVDFINEILEDDFLKLNTSLSYAGFLGEIHK
ncbi:hypothetical protein V6R21_07855 [Limibacter armeniacum]|uniref:hypothetical protein n=1 Tax=Limibacter armeniacum TaxID=466084 RepID=UPI002FE5DB6B